ncbi:MAG: glycine cleavage system protein GcvH [Bacillota bacterium]
MIPDGLKYTEEHEWVRIEGSRAVIGITEHAQEALGDVVFVELPEIGARFKAGDSIAVLESVKAVADVFTQLDGTVAEVNEALLDNPGLINEEPYGQYIAVLELDSAEIPDALMDAKAYAAFLEEGN